jgi:hypothetical protein
MSYTIPCYILDTTSRRLHSFQFNTGASHLLPNSFDQAIDYLKAQSSALGLTPAGPAHLSRGEVRLWVHPVEGAAP